MRLLCGRDVTPVGMNAPCGVGCVKAMAITDNPTPVIRASSNTDGATQAAGERPGSSGTPSSESSRCIASRLVRLKRTSILTNECVYAQHTQVRRAFSIP